MQTPNSQAGLRAAWDLCQPESTWVCSLISERGFYEASGLSLRGREWCVKRKLQRITGGVPLPSQVVLRTDDLRKLSIVTENVVSESFVAFYAT